MRVRSHASHHSLHALGPNSCPILDLECFYIQPHSISDSQRLSILKVSDTFTRNTLMSQEHCSPSNAVAADFQQVLGQCMMKYNKSKDESTISTVRSQVIDVKNVMTRNIDTILEQEERSSISLNRTDDLQTTAEEFQKARKLPGRTWWKYFKVVTITVAILLPIIIILLSTNVIPT
ncbi:vesicle-associated membrane protein 8-like [Carlito syrichta]|uniref:Vesicle-associated membrane protein 7 n=1 Tax=Carlito syrichta TaxID=1868482 RepID=A0A3Q0E060_CARSF|nr:vesicle-associated membrane protein 8-like [Carlito syrichta]